MEDLRNSGLFFVKQCNLWLIGRILESERLRFIFSVHCCSLCDSGSITIRSPFISFPLCSKVVAQFEEIDSTHIFTNEICQPEKRCTHSFLEYPNNVITKVFWDVAPRDSSHFLRKDS